MPRKSSSPGKAKKQKLSKEERSQIAKDRWAKRRNTVAAQEPIQIGRVSEVNKIRDIMDKPPVELEAQVPNGRDKHGVPPVVGLGDGTITPNGDFVPDQPPQAPPPAPQLAPVRISKQKRYTGPKEFSVALRAAEGRLAKALGERAEAAAKLAYLQGEIPNLMDIIKALKGSGTPAAYDFSLPSPAVFQNPVIQPVHNPLAAIQAAMAAPPVSRAQGGAIQFSPDVVGSLEGPDDDNPDRFIAGPNAGASGWIGG